MLPAGPSATPGHRGGLGAGEGGSPLGSAQLWELGFALGAQSCWEFLALHSCPRGNIVKGVRTPGDAQPGLRYWPEAQRAGPARPSRCHFSLPLCHRLGVPVAFIFFDEQLCDKGHRLEWGSSALCSVRLFHRPDAVPKRAADL